MLDFEAVVVLHLDFGSLGLDLVNEPLKLGVYEFEVLDPLQADFVVNLIGLLYESLSLLRHFVELLHYRLSVLSQHIDGFLLPNEVMARVVHDALYADEHHAGVTEVPHHLFGMLGAEV